MNRPTLCLSSILVLGLASSCGGDSSGASASPGTGAGSSPPAAAQPAASEVKLDHNSVVMLFGPEPAAPKVENRLTKAKVDLGKKLYHEVKLSRNGDVSCATCHALDNYGQDGKKTSPGTGGAAGKRNTPTTFNAFRQFKQFWDYRAETVEEQSTMPMLTANEHALRDEAEIVSVLKGIPEYVQAFKEAFPRDDEITAENVQLAIGAFERKLETRSRFDDYLDGDQSALTDAEKRGLKTFMEVGCTTCHTTRLVGGQMVQKFGLLVPQEIPDKGRYEVTKNEGDMYMFKVPQLLNVEKTAPYYHDGSMATLEEATRHMAKIQLGRELSDDQVKSIVTFMKALTGPPPAIALAK